MPHYFVTSPECSVVIPVMDDGSGPTEYFHCVISVDAKNKREAKSIALKDSRMNDWIEEARGDNKSPFSGLVAIDAKCKHGVCWCDLCHGECEKCYEEG